MTSSISDVLAGVQHSLFGICQSPEVLEQVLDVTDRLIDRWPSLLPLNKGGTAFLKLLSLEKAHKVDAMTKRKDPSKRSTSIE